jgi:hypothetical protein
MTDRFKCPACGHWCVRYDDDLAPGWVCSKRGGCGSEWPEPTMCEWFALCENLATHTQSHPILGEVPICDRCQGIYDKQTS